jgi:tetratricopeptide (TPR) repeat protein
MPKKVSKRLIQQQSLTIFYYITFMRTIITVFMRKHFLFCLLCWLCYCTVSAKPINLDSLERHYRLTFEPQQKLALCLLLGKNYQHINYHKAYQYSFEALKIAEQLNDNINNLWAKLQVGEALAFSGRNIESIPYFEQILQISSIENDRKLVIKTLAGLARANMMLNYDDKALKYYLKILDYVTTDTNGWQMPIKNKAITNKPLAI